MWRARDLRAGCWRSSGSDHHYGKPVPVTQLPFSSCTSNVGDDGTWQCHCLCINNSAVCNKHAYFTLLCQLLLSIEPYALAAGVWIKYRIKKLVNCWIRDRCSTPLQGHSRHKEFLAWNTLWFCLVCKMDRTRLNFPLKPWHDYSQTSRFRKTSRNFSFTCSKGSSELLEEGVEEREEEKEVHKERAVKAAFEDMLESHQDESGTSNISNSTIICHT